MSRTPPGDQGINIRKNEVFLLPTRLMPSGADPEEDFSDISLEEGIIEEDEYIDCKDHIEDKSEMIKALDNFADKIGYDIDGRDRPDDALFDNLNEAAGFTPFILCGESHEMECVALWDFFGGNSYDDLNVHAGDIVHIVAEEYQVRLIDETNFMRMPFQWSLGRWITERNVNPYMGLIPSHYVVSKQFYDEHPLLFKWPVWFHGNAEIHEVVHKLYSDRSSLCPGLFAIFSPAWLNIDLGEHRCYFLMILIERGKKHANKLKELIEVERGNYGIMVNSINHFLGEMLPENANIEKTAKMQYIEFMSEIETTPFEPAIVPIHRSSLGHYELTGERYETLYDLVHHLSVHRSALPHKLVYCRSSPLVVGRNTVPPPTQKFKKDLRCQPMQIEQWAATHFDEVTRRFECSEKTLYTTKSVFDIDKQHHRKVADGLKLESSEREAISSFMKKMNPKSPVDDVKGKEKSKEQVSLENLPLHETSIRIKSPFYIEWKQIEGTAVELGKGAFGCVKKGRFLRDSGESVPVAVKRLELKESEKDERNTAFSEMEILEMVAHPNIVCYYGYTMKLCNLDNGLPNNIELYLIFELMETSLDKFIDKSDATLSENEKLDILAQVCRGMSFLHSRTPPIVHGDLAARNVLLKKHPVYHKKQVPKSFYYYSLLLFRYICKITDLGLAKTCLDELYTNYDDPEKIPFKWLPPEVLSSRTLSLKTDVWAFGITCFEVCERVRDPYGALVEGPNLYQYLNDGYRWDQLQRMSSLIYDVAMDCMRKQPVDRPCFEELVDRFLDHIIENEEEDETKVKEREKFIAKEMRKERMQKAHGKLRE